METGEGRGEGKGRKGKEKGKKSKGKERRNDNKRQQGDKLINTKVESEGESSTNNHQYESKRTRKLSCAFFV